MSSANRRIALIYDSRLAYDNQVMHGVAAYVHEHPEWSVYLEEKALKDQRLPDLPTWRGDGIIADFDHPSVAAAVQRSQLPAVGFGSGYGWYTPRSTLPYFFTNNSTIASLAAEHLRSKGIRQFAFCGYPRNPINGWSEEREKAFKAHLARQGYACSVFNGTPMVDRRWTRLQPALIDWLDSLPRPVGIMAANDVRGRQLLEACRTRGIRVPDEVAVIGVDNDELICKLSSPLLTSVEQGGRRLGYEAAALLDRMMQGAQPSTSRHIIDPVGVVTRRSTDILAIEDPKVAEAMSFILQHSSKGLQVKQVLDAVGISRSGLETRFKQILGHTVRVAIRQVQLERARRLIVETTIPLKQVAGDLGYSSVQHMTTVFSRSFGHSPAKYRQNTGAVPQRSGPGNRSPSTS